MKLEKLKAEKISHIVFKRISNGFLVEIFCEELDYDERTIFCKNSNEVANLLKNIFERKNGEQDGRTN